MDKDAYVSADGKYRYWLSRIWDRNVRPLAYIMLNPSTADANKDDPTIRRCIGFAKRDGFGGILVLSLFAYRAAKPSELKNAYDRFGPENDYWIEKLLGGSRFDPSAPIVCAWGGHGYTYEDFDFKYNIPEHAKLMCFGVTKSLKPLHPLYLSNHRTLVPFNEYTQPEEECA